MHGIVGVKYPSETAGDAGFGRAGALQTFDVTRLSSIIYESRGDRAAEVVVIIPLYNYAHTIVEALDSVVNQDLAQLSVVVINDCSADSGEKRAITFLERHAERFAEARVVRHHRNQGPSMSRNSGIAHTHEPFLFMLDADNRIRLPALSRLLEGLRHSGAAFAYSQLCLFGEREGIGLGDVWDLPRLAAGNYIDTMAMLRREALLAVGGYAALAEDGQMEDYDLWCRFAELGLRGVFLPELLCEYRVHGSSRSYTTQNYDTVMAEMALRHPRLVKPPISASATLDAP
jgi:glycosyltransferase involved in cell wall biosynthesis